MDHRGPPGGWDSPANRPTVVEVTVVAGPGRRPRVRRPQVRGAHVLIAIVLLGAIGAIGAAVAIAVLPGGGARTAPPPSTAQHPPTPSQPTVLVYGGPPSGTEAGCQGSPVIDTQRGATAPCWRHGPYVTAVLRRVGAGWRLILEPTGASCPQMPLPPPMRGELKGCRR